MWPSNSEAATSGRWVLGQNYLIEEYDATDLLERTYDSAYCSGIPRFGHRGEFPYEEYVVFDCSTTLDDTSCFNRRYKAIKGSRQGYFRLRLLRSGSCY